MYFTLEIGMDNDAFQQPGEELAVLLRKIAKQVEEGSARYLVDEGARPVLDTNGATVGTWQVRAEEGDVIDTSEPGHEYVDPDEEDE